MSKKLDRIWQNQINKRGARAHERETLIMKREEEQEQLRKKQEGARQT